MAPAASDAPAVRVSHLSKRFRLFHDRNQSLKQSVLQRRRAKYEDFWALRDVSFTVQPGDTFGIIGHNGSGKSTLLKCLTNILQPDEGSVAVNGSVSALLELGAGFHPELSGRENIFLNAAIIGVPRRYIEERFDDIVEFSGLEQFIDTPVKNYSSGMFVRLGFAVAINVDPDILIIDEVLAVGDAAFQAKCADKIAEFRNQDKTIVLVTHSMPDVIRLCAQAAWIDHGKLRALGDPAELADEYLQTSHTDRTVTYQDGARWGSGEIRIANVALLDGEGRPVDQAVSGEPLDIRLVLQAPEPVENPELVVAISDQMNTLVTQVSTRGRDVSVGQVHGRRVISFMIDRLPLTEGTFEMSVSALDSTGRRELDVRRNLLRFDVSRGGSDRDEGLVSFSGTWDLDPRPIALTSST